MEMDYDYKFAYKQHFCLSSSGSESENEEEFQRLYGNYEPLPVPIDPDKVIVIYPDESLNGQNQNQVGTSTNELSFENTKPKHKRNRRKKTAAVETRVIKNVQSEKSSQGSINSLTTNRVTSSSNELFARQVHQTIVDMHSPALDKCVFDQAFPSISTSNFYSSLSLDEMATVENPKAHNIDLVSSKGKRSQNKKKKTQINSQAESNKQEPKPVKPTFKFNEDDFPALRARNLATCTIEYKKDETEMLNQIVNFIKEEVISSYLNSTRPTKSNSVSNGISLYETMRYPVSDNIIVKQSDVIDNMLPDTSFDFLNNYYGFYNGSESEKGLASYQVINDETEPLKSVPQVNEEVVEINESENTAKTTENMRKPRREMNVINTIIQNAGFDLINLIIPMILQEIVCSVTNNALLK